MTLVSRLPRPRRSVLYMPGSNARALEKAKSLAADALILDLEDAVAPDMKETARQQVIAAVQGGGYGNRELIIRVNALSSPWGRDDLAASRDAGAHALLIPKVSTPDMLDDVAAILTDAPASLQVWAMIETPLALLNLREIAMLAHQPETRLAAWVMGTNDLAKETGAGFGRERLAMLPWLMQALAAARAYGLDIIDGVYNTLDDAKGFEAECQQGKLCGFNGKTLIHPQQIETANQVFSPSEDEIHKARAIVAAFSQPEHADKGAISLDGRMVERLHADMAARTLALAEAIETKKSG